jgi:hypothetical protein
MTATSYYRSFYNYEGTSRTPQDVVSSCLHGAGTAYGERAVQTGAFDAMVNDYIAAIQALLPKGIILCGSEFIGPANGRFNEELHQAIREAIEAADLAPIIKRHDFPMEEDNDLDAIIARHEDAIEDADLNTIIAKHEDALKATYAVTAYAVEYGETHEVHVTVEAENAEAALAKAKADLAERGRPNIQDAIARLISS